MIRFGQIRLSRPCGGLFYIISQAQDREKEIHSEQCSDPADGQEQDHDTESYHPASEQSKGFLQVGTGQSDAEKAEYRFAIGMKMTSGGGTLGLVENRHGYGDKTVIMIDFVLG